jgi:hypothetical protein
VKWSLTPFLTFLTACGVTPLTSKIRVGEEAFVLGVGEGSDGQTDLFAAPAGGGSFTRITFTRAEEAAPRLSPSGTGVTFLRRNAPGEPWSLVLLDLLTNRESAAPIPRVVGEPVGIGWSVDGSQVAVRAQGFLVTPTPPRAVWLRAVPLDSVPWADSVTGGLLGQPPKAMIASCGDVFCVVAGADTTRLQGVREPIPWGPDSLGYFIGSTAVWEVRPLGGGHTRRPVWTDMPEGLRQLTYQRGSPAS